MEPLDNFPQKRDFSNCADDLVDILLLVVSTLGCPDWSKIADDFSGRGQAHDIKQENHAS